MKDYQHEFQYDRLIFTQNKLFKQTFFITIELSQIKFSIYQLYLCVIQKLENLKIFYKMYRYKTVL